VRDGSRIVTPLRIAHIVNDAFSLESANGVQQMVYCLVSAQVALGQSVAVFSREGGVRLLGIGAEVIPPFGSRAVPPERGSSLPQRALSFCVERRLSDDVLAWRPDIVHFHSVHIPRNVSLAARLSRAGVPYCVTVHGGLFRAALQRGRLKKILFKVLLERRYLNDAQFIHAVSPAETEEIRQHGVVRPIVVVPNGLPFDPGVQAARPDAIYAAHPSLRGQQVFMFLGRLDTWHKGLDLLIEAFAQAGLRDAALVLVGPDWFGSRRALTALAERLGVLSRLVFTGPAFGVERASLLAIADVFVHPSRWEGLSLSVLTAAAAGKPCLLTHVADPLAALERAEAAIVVDPNVPSIAEGLRRAAGVGPQELLRMGIRAQRVAEAQFSWASIAGRLLEVYRAALENDLERFPSLSTAADRGL
jgi:glycosyltransferase involved in cell wall biosynthesis